ncbi:MAG: Gldg family protein [Thermoguttaceae bacterium]
MNIRVLLAVFRRNFVSYFANPTGYVFICLFVLLGATLAFCLPEFFSNNLANLDQLSYWLPFVMLIYIPTITMGVWADERRQGTDELLLTIPARDFDIVLGKYLGAVAIFTVALVFSMLCNLAVLEWLSTSDFWSFHANEGPDVGLFLGTYFGYWLVGLAMLAIGVVASFLTGNITIAYVLGVLFNLPLVFLNAADAVFGVFGRQSVLAIKSCSIGYQFADFSRGVMSFAGVVYFVMIVVVMLYLSMILIGRRHWYSGVRRWSLTGHYATRTLALGVVAVGAVLVFHNHDLRCDVTTERLSSLSPQTRKLVSNLKTGRPVRVEAFISPSVPEEYVAARKNLLDVLQEFKAIGGAKLQVLIHDTDRYTEEATLAEKKYGIEPREITAINRRSVTADHIYLHVAVKCGSGKAIVSFIDQDTPVEYELVRSICVQSQQKRMKVGVLMTDAPLFGGFTMQGMTPNWPLVDELEKQYEVVRIDPSKPITEKCDVLLAVQPSALGPAEMANFIGVVRGGQPTAIFEDPSPVFCRGVPASSAPRQSPGGMGGMFGGQRLPKGDITALWRLLGVDVAPDQIVWQDYNPYQKLSNVFGKEHEFVFVNTEGGGAKSPFGEDPISSGLQQILFPFPGAITPLNSSSLRFTSLAKTGDKTGTERFGDLMAMGPMGPQGLNPDRPLTPTALNYVLAAHIQGTLKLDPADGAEKAPADKKKTAAKKPAEANINVVLVCDIDLFSQIIFGLRDQPDVPELGIRLKFDNITFVLNALDSLAGDDRFLEIRKRRPKYRTLNRIEQWTAEDRKNAAKRKEQFLKKVADEEAEAQKEMDDKIAELKKRKNGDSRQAVIEFLTAQQDLQRQLETKVAKHAEDKKREEDRIQTELKVKKGGVENKARLMAMFLPPILPLLVAVGVFFNRRSREREGVARSRLR